MGTFERGSKAAASAATAETSVRNLHAMIVRCPREGHARHLIAALREDYNHHRPHTSLDGFTAREFLNRSAKGQTLNGTNF